MTIFPSISEVSITKNSSAIFFDKVTPENNLIIESFEFTNDAISSLYLLKLSIKFPFKNFKEDSLKEMLNEKIQIKIVYNKLAEIDKPKLKFITGYVTETTFIAFTEEEFIFELKVVPPFYQTKLNNAFRCWNNITAKDAIIDVLSTYKNLKINYEFILPKPKELLVRKNIIQYGESDYLFICRLLHEEYLNYIFKQEEEDVKLIFIDEVENKLFLENKKNPVKVQLSHSILSYQKNTYVSNFFGYHHTITEGIQKTVAQFRDPRDIQNFYKSEAKIETKNSNSFYKQAQHYKASQLQTNGISQFYTENECNRKNTLKNRITFSHHLNFLSIGEVIEFIYKNNPEKSTPVQLGNYFIASLRHYFSKKNLELSTSTVIPYNYQVDVVAYPITERFIADYTEVISSISPPSLTTALIFGKNKDELVLDTKEDDHYVGITFDWPQSNSNTTKESKYVLARVSQFWASKKSGAIFNPQPGDEVLVAFLNNDIEQPVIVRYFYNSTQLPPKLSAEEDKTGLQFRGIGLDASLEKNLKIAFIDEADNKADFLMTNQGLLAKSAKNMKLETTENLQTKSTKDTIIEAVENIKTSTSKETTLTAKGNIKITAPVADINEISIK